MSALTADGAKRRPRSRIWSRPCAAPRAVWLMVPASVVDAVIAQLRRCSRRATSSSTAAIRTTTMTSAAPMSSQKAKIHFVDVGTSGGVLGLERGYCLMIGGEEAIVASPRCRFSPPWRPAERPPSGGKRAAHGTAAQGYLHCGAQRRGPLREDGPQRHRVRADGGLRGRPQYSQARQRRPASPGRRDAETAPLTEPRLFQYRSIWRRSPKCGATAASSPRSCWI